MKLKLAGAAMTLGGLLLILRIAPVVASKPDSVAFPPATTADLVSLAAAAGGAWPLAHVLGLIAILLLFYGYMRHGETLVAAGHGKIGRVAAVIAGMGFILFSGALIVDGFVVYNAALASAEVPGDAEILAKVASSHALALSFFTPALFVMFIAVGVLSSRMLHGLVHYRWLGALGMLISIVAVTLYLSGIAGPNWNNMQTGGLITMIGFVWHILVGLAALFGRGVKEVTGDPKQR